MSLTYRAADHEDLSTLVVMLADDNLGEAREDVSIPLNSAYSSAFDAIASDPNNELVVVEREGHIVGMLQLTFIPYLTYYRLMALFDRRRSYSQRFSRPRVRYPVLRMGH